MRTSSAATPRPHRTLIIGSTALAVVLGGALSGCAGATDDDVARAADAFHAALSDRDGAAACASLSPATASELAKNSGKPCRKAILSETVPVPAAPGTVALYDTAGQVHYEREVVFLSEFPDGWKVVAAGCTPNPPGPYDCLIKAG